MSKKLHISDELSLPIDAATQTFAFIARKGAGKTYAAGKLVELLMAAEVQVVILDAVGNWYGLRISADGKGKGFDIPVLGGLRGDIPLEASGGELISDIIVESGRSIILDVSQFSKADRQRFATALGERLWLRKKGERHPNPLHLVIEESQLIVPENFSGDGARMVGIYEEIIRLGRNYGIGVTMISQRPQSVNKEVLNQTECLFVGQVNGSQERKALKLWITHQGMDVHLVDELPGLPIGTFYVWSPQWLQILKKVQIAEKKTFDASATPKVGQNRVRRELKPLNLDDLKEKLAATIEKKKAEDPRELKKQVAQLKNELAKAQQQKPAAPAKTKTVEKFVLKDGQLKKVEAILDRMGKVYAQAADIEIKLLGGIDGIRDAIRKTTTPAPVTATRPVISQRSVPIPQTPRPIARKLETSHEANGNFITNSSQQRVLNAIAWFNSIGVEAPSKSAVGLVAKIKPTGGHFSNTMGPLSTNGLIRYSGDGVMLTEAGAELAGMPEPPPTMESYHHSIREVLRKKSGASVRIFDVIVGAGGGELPIDQVGEAAGIDAGGGHFSNSIGPLGTLGLIERRGGMVRPTELMFPPALVARVVSL